jgi:hypothetical protein
VSLKRRRNITITRRKRRRPKKNGQEETREEKEVICDKNLGRHRGSATGSNPLNSLASIGNTTLETMP